MRVGVLTSWDTQCGIAEYSRYLVNAMRNQGIEVVVLGSRNYDERDQRPDLAEEFAEVFNQYRVFDVELWNKYGHNELDVERILELNLDVLHVQYEIVLYNEERLYELLEKFEGLKVITYHDNCIHPGFRYDLFDLRYSHREDTGAGEGILLPMGIENRPPLIKTFGLGRSRSDIIEDICKTYGWTFEKSFGEVEWKSQAQLYAWLRDSDAVVLYYDDVPMAGSSIAARVALSTRRPVFVNDVTWFRDLKHDPPRLTKVDDASELEQALQAFFSNRTIDENSWDNIAKWTIEDYRESIRRLNKSLRRNT